mmetsp:Transcript_13200/g.20125  ORF Transcript_13200/g.20125 Transcript_13200/m.20125 type:complete len:172 (+) Transcript_13200:2670-3185(+)
MTIVDIHSSSISNRQLCSDQVDKRKKTTRRMPFKSLSTNTPSKPKTGKPTKTSSLLRSYSAPTPQSPPLVRETEAENKEQITETQNNNIDIFRETSDEATEELEAMWTLKRANPVFDEDDDDFEASPSKRAKTFTYFDAIPESRDDELSESQIIYWDDRLIEENCGFTFDK